MTSSLMPKVDPPKLNRIIDIGITKIPLSPRTFAKVNSPRSMAPVFRIIPKAPPTMRTKATTSTAEIIPSAGAISIEEKPCP